MTNVDPFGEILTLGDLLRKLLAKKEVGRTMKIEVLGMGCANCKKLYESVLKTVEGSGKEVQVDKVENIPKIMAYGVLSTPALVIDGVVKVAGKVPKPEELKKWIIGD
jgi:small redox-active disulfide protein 2